MLAVSPSAMPRLSDPAETGRRCGGGWQHVGSVLLWHVSRSAAPLADFTGCTMSSRHSDVDSDARVSEQLNPPLLPVLDMLPVASPGCCLALSTPLLAHLRSLLPVPPHLILSIGSGCGLLEALLLNGIPSLHVVGVEVEPSSNRHLPTANHRVVVGTRFLDHLAAEAAAWLFVYPRRMELLQEYLAAYGGHAVKTIVWAGPQADWGDYRGCFDTRWNVQVYGANEVGGRASELIAVATTSSG